MELKLVVVDDHPLVREGIAMRIGMYPDLKSCDGCSRI